MTQWAVVQLGGKQHLVKVASKIRVNRIDQKEGETLKLVSLLDKQTPVELKILAEERGPKIEGLKFKPKTRYQRRYGHRQPLSVLEVLTIGQAKTSKLEAPKEEKTVVKKPIAKTTKAKTIQPSANQDFSQAKKS
jgi:large subunit ribosomal protein L21